MGSFAQSLPPALTKIFRENDLNLGDMEERLGMIVQAHWKPFGRTS